MTDPSTQTEKPRGNRRFSQEQYDMLVRCSKKKDVAEWNQWRKEHPDEDIWLQNGDFTGCWLGEVNFIGETVLRQADGREIDFRSKVHLESASFENAHLQHAVFGKAHLEQSRFSHADAKGADFHSAHLEHAKLGVADFEGCDFTDAVLENASFTPSQLNGAKFTNTNLKGCSMRACVVDGSTRFWNCIINRYSKSQRFTDFTGTALSSVIITPGEKQLLEYNIRRMNWEAWYEYKKWQVSEDERHVVIKKSMWFIRKFWQISDYGLSTKQIIWTFFKWAFVFAAVYYVWGFIDYCFVGITDHPGVVTDLFVLADGQQAVSCWLVPFRAVYFSIVTMTTLGFGDMYANAQSICGHILLTIQVILGYVLLGALITRFAVLFTAGGPAGRFADEEKEDDER